MFPYVKGGRDMPANVFDLAIALVQAAPEVVPHLVEALGNHVTPAQKQSLLSMQRPATLSSRMMSISSAQWQRQPSPQLDQNYMNAIRYVPHKEPQQLVNNPAHKFVNNPGNDIVLSIAREHQRQVKEHFLFVRLFLIICLLLLVIGIILIIHYPPLGSLLTVIGSFTSVTGGFIVKSYSESHKRLDNFLKAYPQLQGL